MQRVAVLANFLRANVGGLSPVRWEHLPRFIAPRTATFPQYDPVTSPEVLRNSEGKFSSETARSDRV